MVGLQRMIAAFWLIFVHKGLQYSGLGLQTLHLTEGTASHHRSVVSGRRTGLLGMAPVTGNPGLVMPAGQGGAAPAGQIALGSGVKVDGPVEPYKIQRASFALPIFVHRGQHGYTDQ